MIRDYDGEANTKPKSKRSKRIVRFIKENGLPLVQFLRFNEFAKVVEHDASEPHGKTIVLFKEDIPVAMYQPKLKVGYIQAGSVKKELEVTLASDAAHDLENRPKTDGYLGRQVTIGPGWAES